MTGTQLAGSELCGLELSPGRPSARPNGDSCLRQRINGTRKTEGGTTMPDIRPLAGGLVCGVMLLITGSAYTQTRVQPEPRTAQSEAAQVGRVSSLMGAAVELRAGEKAGTIRGIVISPQGTISFFVVDFEEQLILVPF